MRKSKKVECPCNECESFKPNWWSAVKDAFATFCTVFSYGFMFGLGLTLGAAVVMALFK